MQALARAKFAVGVHAVHMDNDRIRVDEDEDENGVELNVDGFHAAQDDEGDEMLSSPAPGKIELW